MRIPESISGSFSVVLDFLFPVNESVKKFEKSSASELVGQLPPSETIESSGNVNDAGDVTTLFAYSDQQVKHLVWEIKYYRNEKISDAVGALLAQKIREKMGAEKEEFFLVPIPLTNRRLRERGFNHTEMIAKSILKNLEDFKEENYANFSLETGILKKIRHTPKQSSIENREDRFKNIVGAFEVADSISLARKNIIIVDDVVTTGATIAEAKRAIEKAGAKNVWSFAIAH